MAVPAVVPVLTVATPVTVPSPLTITGAPLAIAPLATKLAKPACMPVRFYPSP